MLPLNIDIVQILLHMLNFVILAGGLTLLLYKPVCRFLEERKEYFAKIAKENEENAAANEQLKAEYEKKLADAKVTIEQQEAEARKRTAEEAKAYLDEAKEKAAAVIKEAEQEAEQRRRQILDSAQTEIGELVIEATQKLICETSTPEKNKELYDEFLKCTQQ